MAKTKISEFNANPALNTDIDSINLAEGCAPSGINDAIRELMSQLKDWQSGTSNDPYVVGSSGSLTLNQGTANGVAYLNGSKVVTSGSALTFDGTNLGVGTSSPSYKLDVRTGSGNAYANVGRASKSAGQVALQLSGGTSGTDWIIYQDTNSDNLRFFGNSDTRMTIDSSGNLGLGVTPSAWGASYKAVELLGGVALTSYSTVGDMQLFANAYSDGGSYRYKTSTYASNYEQYQGKHIWYTAPSGTAGNAITFTQAMSLLSSGAWVLGDTSVVASGFAGVKFNGASFNGLGLNDSSSTSGVGFIYFQSNGTTIGTITRVGATSAVAYNTSSDYRLKNITGPVTTSGSYIDSLNPVEGTWKADGSTFVGLIAHEVQEASRTQVATGTKDGAEMQAMDYSSAELIANLIAEVKSLRQRVATLEAK